MMMPTRTLSLEIAHLVAVETHIHPLLIVTIAYSSFYQNRIKQIEIDSSCFINKQINGLIYCLCNKL